MTKIVATFTQQTSIVASLLVVAVLSSASGAKAHGHEAEVEALQEQVDMLLELTASMRADDENIYFEGVNVHVRDGSGATESTSGFGNLIVGYDENAPDGSDKSGTHNLVVGSGHTYASYAGLVAGLDNRITAPFATVTGGKENTASGDYSSVSGGRFNNATENYSSILY
jgi:hypothetical protein